MQFVGHIKHITYRETNSREVNLCNLACASLITLCTVVYDIFLFSTTGKSTNHTISRARPAPLAAAWLFGGLCPFATRPSTLLAKANKRENLSLKGVLP
jgi:hypothetical protein